MVHVFGLLIFILICAAGYVLRQPIKESFKTLSTESAKLKSRIKKENKK